MHVSAVRPGRYIIKLVCSIPLIPTPRHCRNPRNMAPMESIASMHLGTRHCVCFISNIEQEIVAITLRSDDPGLKKRL